MRIVLAPQSLKGSLDASAVAEAMAAGVASVFAGAEIVACPVADGGEGTVRALVAATDGRLERVTVTGPLGEPVDAEYGVLGGTYTAVIEMAAASGLPLVSLGQRDPRRASTYGTGELMRAALDIGCERLLIGIGGSATNDGGAGMAQALGVHLVDDEGRELPPGGAALARLARIDASALDERVRHVQVQVACDVTNPLYGAEGASAVYGPQKGATPQMVRELDAALMRYAEVIRRDLGADVAPVPGAGAAGGLGAGLLAFAGASLIPGAQLVLDALDFAAKVEGAALVLTAEGRLDAQTAYGKAVGAVAAASRQAGAYVIALAGSIEADDDALLALGIDAAIPLVDGPMTLEASMERAAELVTRATARALRLIALGQSLSED